MVTTRLLLTPLLGAAFTCQAQSIMYSPVAASSPDLTLEFGYTYDLLFDHSGLSFTFTSGQTGWASQMCSFTHDWTTDLECWSIMDLDLDTAHVIVDMGSVLTWDRMAFFNEEACGFGLDPIRVEYGNDATGPWSLLCDFSLTNHPTGMEDYPPDVLDFPFHVTARYFRIRGSTPDVLHRFTIAEIILGTASLAPPTGACMQACLPTGVAEREANAAFAILSADGRSIDLLGKNVDEVGCLDHLGREMPIHRTGDRIDIRPLQEGAYVLVARFPNGMRTLRFVVAQ
jgi:hypothetical protein